MSERTIKDNPGINPRIVISVWQSFDGRDSCVGNRVRVQSISGNDERRCAMIEDGVRQSIRVEQTPVWQRRPGSTRDVSAVLQAARTLASLWALPVVSNDAYLLGMAY